MLSRVFQWNLRAKEIVMVRRVTAIVMLPITVFYMSSLNLLAGGMMSARADDAVISTVSTIANGASDPNVVVTLAGENTFTETASEILTNWTIGVGSTGLSAFLITKNTDKQVTITFTGTAAAGSVTIKALNAALSENHDSNEITVVVPTATSYTVTFDANGSTGGTKPSDQTKTHDVTLVLAANTGTLVKTGYTFAGWNTAADASGTSYAEGANYTDNAGDTLYAKWTADQTITFGALGGKTYGDSAFDVSATATSGLTVSFGSQTESICTVIGTTVTIISAGDCTVRASQSGNGSYNPATPVDRTFTVSKATPTATLAVSNSPQSYTGSGQAATVGITASSVAGAVQNILTGGAATQTNAATYAVTANFVPTDTTNYNTLTAISAGNFVINNASQSAPTGLAGVAPSTYGASDGKITGTTVEMEYKLSGAGSYTVASATETTSLAAGDYKVRLAAKTGFNASPDTDVTIAAGANASQSAPTGLAGVAPSTYGASDGKITGTTVAMEYKLSTDSSYVAASATETTGLAAGDYKVRLAAKTGFNASPDTDVTIAAGANASQPVVTTSTDDHSCGKKCKLTKEYRKKYKNPAKKATYTQVKGLKKTNLAEFNRLSSVYAKYAKLSDKERAKLSLKIQNDFKTYKNYRGYKLYLSYTK